MPGASIVRQGVARPHLLEQIGELTMASKTHPLMQFGGVAALSLALGLGAAATVAQAQGMVAGAGSSRSASETVTVKSVDKATRHLVVTDAKGDSFGLKAPSSVRNF